MIIIIIIKVAFYELLEDRNRDEKNALKDFQSE